MINTGRVFQEAVDILRSTYNIKIRDWTVMFDDSTNTWIFHYNSVYRMEVPLLELDRDKIVEDIVVSLHEKSTD